MDSFSKDHDNHKSSSDKRMKMEKDPQQHSTNENEAAHRTISQPAPSAEEASRPLPNINAIDAGASDSRADEKTNESLRNDHIDGGRVALSFSNGTSRAKANEYGAHFGKPALLVSNGDVANASASEGNGNRDKADADGEKSEKNERKKERKAKIKAESLIKEKLRERQMLDARGPESGVVDLTLDSEDETYTNDGEWTPTPSNDVAADRNGNRNIIGASDEPICVDNEAGKGSHDMAIQTHVIFAIDFSSSMKKMDVKTIKGQISRWAAVFECVDSFLTQQMQQQHHQQESNENFSACFISVLIFNERAQILLDRMPLLGNGEQVRQALNDARKSHTPKGGTCFAAGFQEASRLAHGDIDDNVILVFLSDGRPGDLQHQPPNHHDIAMQKTFKRNKIHYDAAGHYIEKMRDGLGNFDLHLICLCDEGKPVRTSRSRDDMVCEISFSRLDSPSLTFANIDSGLSIYRKDTMERFTAQTSLWMTTTTILS